MIYKKILLLAHDGEDFYKARIPFAKFLIQNGFQVFVVVPKDKYTQAIIDEGLTVFNGSLERDNLNPFDLLRTIFQVRSYARDNQIDLVHSFKFIPNLINVLSNLFASRKVVLHIAGLGIAFANNSFKYLVIRNIFRLLFFFQFLRANLVIIQNPDDFNDFYFKDFFRKKIKVVKGSGVDIQRFNPVNRKTVSTGKLTFLCTTRLIWEKGIAEMAEAFSSLSGQLKTQTELIIIGEPDVKNPRAVTPEFIAKYQGSAVVRFVGKKERIQDYLNNADVFILPSYYREGIPRSILEALASGLPVITTTVPGCNLTVKDGKNGFMIEPRSSLAIKNAVEKMIAQRASWPEMGAYSRELAVTEFSENTVFGQIVNLYHS